MAPRQEARRLLALVLALCAVCAWTTHALLAPVNALAFASLLTLCRG
ncbi:hypothetical protein [Pseudoduganella chitinolytica]|uniref:Uncharacterized protein n=1 Tax=Pseudoduganella chitinolytica TaxID=34070 RepID=A0ABY8B806_9BURK|nr:hypothetical protein [Pseudoduganella chitinolytica]WEF32030.1 hypothetical protein PX653_21770 [Pseudoduganella chitinolytica]